MLIACSTYELIRFCMSVHCLSEWVRWLEKKSLSLLISQPAPGLWGLFSPRVLLLARFLPPCHRQRPVLLTWVEAWPVPFWQSALGSHEDLGTSVFNVEIPPPSVETFFFFFWQAPLGHVTHMKFLLKGLTLTVGFLSLSHVSLRLSLSQWHRSAAHRHPKVGRHRGTGYGRSSGTVSYQW